MVDDKQSDDWHKNAVTTPVLCHEYPNVFGSRYNMSWHFRHRKTNGLEAADVCRKGPNGRIYWHKRRALDWRTGLLR